MDAETQRNNGRGRKRDSALFEAWCRELERPLYGYLLRMVHQSQEAEDLAQETLLRVFRLWQSGQLKPPGELPRPLVFSIAHNLAVDSARRQARAAAGAVEGASQPGAQQGDLLLHGEIARALDEVPEKHREALLLREYGQLRYREIAKTLGVSVDAVKVWIYRARQQLATLLDRDGQYIGGAKEEAAHDA